MKENNSVICENRKARHEYHIIETFEAGVELRGTEVKSLRNNRTSLSEAYATFKTNELYIQSWHISPYEQGNRFNKDPLRDRKLLLHKKEILYLQREVQKSGFTLVPLKLYFKNSKVKLLLGLCKGKKLYDKRDDLKKKDMEKEAKQYVKLSQRS